MLGMSVYTRQPEKVDQAFVFNILLLLFTCILMTHLQRYVFIRLGWLSYRLPRLIPRLMISSLITSIGIAGLDILADYLTGFKQWGVQPIEMGNTIITVFAVLLLVLLWNGIYFTFHFFQKSRRQEITNLELEASNRESELKNLRSQLNPHFLFNSLNSIKALVDIDPDKAKKSITTLSNLLRQSLILGKENLVNLESELSIAKSYLDLEKIRFEERLSVEWEVNENLEHFQIPPFSLQMMVENAIKHGISNLKNGGVVKIKAYQEEGAVIVEVVNSGDLKEVVDLGVGIQNIKRRLSLQYGQLADFNLVESNGFVHAKMSFSNERV